MNEGAPHAPFPSDETLAAFIDGRLDPETRRRVIEHMATCSQCYDVMLAANELREKEAAPRVVPFRPRAWTIRLAAAAVIAVVLLFVVPRQSKNGLAALAAAAPPQRNIEGRLTGFPYRPLKPVTRGSEEEDTSPEHLKLLAVAAQVAADAKKNPTPENLHAYGVSLLMLGRSDAAVSTLEEALQKQTGEQDVATAISRCADAELLNDLSAAYDTRWAADRLPADLLLAMEASQRAWRLRRTADIAWNRAIATEQLHVEGAASAWRDYLMLDPSSPWAMEIRSRKLAPRSQNQPSLPWPEAKPAVESGGRDAVAMIRLFPQQSRMLAEEELLPRWAAAVRDGDAAAVNRTKTAISLIAREIERSSGDDLLVRTIAAIPSSGQPELVDGFIAYRKARAAYRNRDIANAAPLFRQSAQALSLARNPFAIMPALFQVACAYYENDFRGVVAQSDALLRGRDARVASAATAQLYWLRAGGHRFLGDMQAAIGDYRIAQHQFESLHEDDNILAMHELAAECLQYVGDTTAEWRDRLIALELLQKQSERSGRREQLLDSAARAAAAENLPLTALVLLNHELERVSDSAFIDTRAYALIWRHELRARLGMSSEAAVDLDAAIRLIDEVRDPAVRLSAMNAPDIVSALLPLRPSASERIALLQGALRFARSTNDGVRIAQIDLLIGQENVREGALAEGRKAFLEGIEEVERQRSALTSMEMRDAYMAAREGLYREAIDLSLRDSNPQQAFELTERMRARTLLDLTSIQDAQPLTLAAVQHSLPTSTAIVEYVALGDRLVTFVVQHSAFRAYAVAIGRDAVAALARNCVAAAAHDERARSAGAFADMSRYAVRPWIESTGSVRTIVFSPDELLSDVAFAACVDHRRRFVIQEHRVAIAPSASVYVACLQRESVVRSRDAVPLIVGADAASAGGLAPLRSVDEETAAIAKRYPGCVVLRNEDATADAFWRAAERASIIHFAGHAIRNSRYAEWSALLLGPQSAQPAVLYARDICAHPLHKTRLVVLMGCDTAHDSLDALQGASSVAKAFIAAGVPSVVGSLWAVNDEVAKEFAIRLHSALDRGETPLDALRDTEISMMESPNPVLRSPNAWAAFEMLGSTS